MKSMTEAACFLRNSLRPPAWRWHTLQALVTVENCWLAGALLACAVAGRRNDALEHKHKAGLRSRSHVNCTMGCPMLLAIGFSQLAVTRKAAASQHSLHQAVLIMKNVCKYFSSWRWQSGLLGQEGNKGGKWRTGRRECYWNLHCTTSVVSCAENNCRLMYSPCWLKNGDSLYWAGGQGLTLCYAIHELENKQLYWSCVWE